jgi:hypothetical protein
MARKMLLTVFEKCTTITELRQILDALASSCLHHRLGNSRLHFQNWPRRKGLQIFKVKKILFSL